MDKIVIRLTEWLERFMVEHQSAKIADDVPPGVRPPPADILTPERIRSALICELRTAVADGEARFATTEELAALAGKYLEIDLRRGRGEVRLYTYALARELSPLVGVALPGCRP